MDNKKRKEEGLVYHYDDPILYEGQRAYQEALFDYNALRPTQIAEKRAQLSKLMASAGEGCTVEVPVHSPWGCHHVHLGDGVYVNSNCTFVDDAAIYIGDHTMLGPNVVIASAGHPILPVLREHNYVYAKEVRIGRNVWIGATATILPGVTIGDNSVIGAGSVVTRDIESNVVACGSPCRVKRKIGDRDKKYFFKDEELDVEE